MVVRANRRNLARPWRQGCRSDRRLCATALRQPDRHAALTFLAQSLPSLDTPVPGIRNEGLFALHELTSDVSQRPGWQDYVARAHGIVGAEGQQLLTKLGYSVERLIPAYALRC